MKQISTYDGEFYTNQLVAIAIFKIAFYDEIQITRGHNVLDLDSADYIVGVDDLVDLSKDNFYKDAKSAWNEFGEKCCAIIGHVANPKELADLVSKQFIDLISTPSVAISLDSIVKYYNKYNVYCPEQEVAFREAVDFMTTLLKKVIIKHRHAINE